jgi:mono/diheme cytochrome c family protein
VKDRGKAQRLTAGWFIVFALASPPAMAWAGEPDGADLYAEHCASCHGANLEGQPDWRNRRPDGRLPAPPHDASGHTWHHSDRQLMTIVRAGLAAIVPGYQTDMPAYGSVLSDSQIRSILQYIKSSWPQQEQAYQKARSEDDPE